MEQIQSKNLARHYLELKIKSTFGKVGAVDEPYPGLFSYKDNWLLSPFLVGHVCVKQLKMTDLLFAAKWKKTKVYQEILMLSGQLSGNDQAKRLFYIHCAIPLFLLSASALTSHAIDGGEYGIITLENGIFVPVDPYFKEIKKEQYDNGDEAPVEVVG